MDDIVIYKVDESYIRVECEDSIARELSEFFTFEVPGAKFMPAFKRKVWDGKLRLFNTKNHQIYTGLAAKIKQFALRSNYSITLDKELEETWISSRSVSRSQDKKAEYSVFTSRTK